jgi:N-acetylglucosamine-6-phosphate deacetylase
LSDSTLWVNGVFYTPEGIIRNGKMLVAADGTIEAIGGSDLHAAADAHVYDLNGLSVLPGLIDVHIHGGAGCNVMNGTYEDLDAISKFHAMHGTTSLLATTGTAPADKINRALKCAADAMAQGVSGAEIVGVHLEGPFLSMKRRGAQDPEHIRPADLAELEQYLHSANGSMRLATIAPEIEGGMDAVEYLVNQGVTVSIGHSDATLAQVEEAVRLGAKHTTHHFNGMSPLHHREPGVAGAGLTLPQLTVELIADGIHVHPAVAKLMFDIKSAWNVCVITDAVTVAGLPDGDYGEVVLSDGQVVLKENGSLAGSTLTTIQALRNVIAFTGLSLEKVIPSFTLVPARQIGIIDRKGSLEPGKDADFLIVDEHEQLTIHSTHVRGKEVYSRSVK